MTQEQTDLINLLTEILESLVNCCDDNFKKEAYQVAINEINTFEYVGLDKHILSGDFYFLQQHVKNMEYSKAFDNLQSVIHDLTLRVKVFRRKITNYGKE